MIPDIHLSEPVGPAGAPLLVLGHSLGTSPVLWEKVVLELIDVCRVSLLTLPGHGDVPVPSASITLDDIADALADALREWGESDVVYAGVSIGGAIGLTLAIRHGDLLAGAVIVASAANLGTADHWHERSELVRQQSTSVLIAPSARSWFAPGSIEREPDLSGRLLHALQDTADEGYARCADALAEYDVRDALGEATVPVLVLWGEYDTVAPEASADEIVAGVRNGRAVRIADAGHQPPAEQPAQVAAQLRSFIREVTA